MGSRPGRWRCLVAFAAGIALPIVSWAVTRVLGDASWSVTVDWAAGLIGMAFAVSLPTGVNLGLPPSIRNLAGDAGPLVSVSGGLSLLVFSLTAMFVGPFVTALL